MGQNGAGKMNRDRTPYRWNGPADTGETSATRAMHPSVHVRTDTGASTPRRGRLSRADRVGRASLLTLALGSAIGILIEILVMADLFVQHLARH